MSKYIYIFLVLSLVSCKTKELVKIEYVKDSSEVVQYKDRVVQLENQVVQYKTQLEETRTENEKLQANTNVVIKRYDTTRETNPIIEEVFLNRTETSDKTSETDKKIIAELSKELETLRDENIQLERSVNFLENQKLDIKKEVKAKFQWWLLLIGFFLGLFVYFYLNLLVDNIKKII